MHELKTQSIGFVVSASITMLAGAAFLIMSAEYARSSVAMFVISLPYLLTARMVDGAISKLERDA
jgi:heme/copper-type cytochrome/quinol oxidase subunit 4